MAERLTRGQQRLYSGDYNTVWQEWQDDGSVIITMSRQGERTATSMHVDEPYSEREEVLTELEIEHGPSAGVRSRLEVAHAARNAPDPERPTPGPGDAPGSNPDGGSGARLPQPLPGVP